MNSIGKNAAQDATFLRNLRFVAAVEATTLILLLFVAVPLKHLAGLPVAVRVMGPVHGIAFVAYLWMVIASAASGVWRRDETVRLVVAAFVPFGGFVNAAWLARREAAR